MGSLQFIDFSYNNLEGTVPDFQGTTSELFTNNKNLCGHIQGLHPCNASSQGHGARSRSHKVTFIVIFSTVGAFIVLILCIIATVSILHREGTRAGKHCVMNPNAFSIWNFDGKTVYEDIIQRTENFDEKYCIGKERMEVCTKFCCLHQK
ncbi:putative LRR receptor-like serine/threonine-protein kinase [Platanthera zijinensis]|uniref:non-specific serine/threonine protein kinase n=1 Tax=Platanthera zijinensis TaxID=2320716 RepID=A0AAP0BBY9_9ASPA